jgi:hypothetical protein
MPMDSGDLWARIVGWLADGCSGAGLRTQSWAYSYASAEERSNVTVNLVDCSTDDEVVIMWLDSTKCRYSEQVWRRTKARSSGYCSLSGAQIRRGDDVYRPNARRAGLVNADAMILVSELRNHVPKPPIESRSDLPSRRAQRAAANPRGSGSVERL